MEKQPLLPVLQKLPPAKAIWTGASRAHPGSIHRAWQVLLGGGPPSWSQQVVGRGTDQSSTLQWGAWGQDSPGRPAGGEG